MVRAPDLKSGDPVYKSHSNYQLKLFQLVPGSTTLLRLYIVIWSAFCPLGFLTCELYFSSFFHFPEKAHWGAVNQVYITYITLTKTLTVNCVTRSIQCINFFCREFCFNKMIRISKSCFSSRCRKNKNLNFQLQ